MKRFLNQQTLLKGSLFLALAANLSWGDQIQSMSLSSEMKTDSPVASQPPLELEPSTDLSMHGQPRPEMPVICGQRFYVTYQEILVGENDKVTEINVKPMVGTIEGFKPLKIRANGGFDVTLGRLDIKQEIDSKVGSAIQRSFNHCGDDGIALIGERRQVRPRNEAKFDLETIKAGMAECRLNSKGEPLTEVQQTRCELDQLTALDNETDPKDSREKQIALNKIDRIMAVLKKSITNRLLSGDQAKIDEGDELFKETRKTLLDLSRDLELDTFHIQHSVGEIDTIKVASALALKSQELDNQLKQLQLTTNDALNQATAATRANPRDPIAAQRLQAIQRDITTKQQNIRSRNQIEVTNGAYRALVAANTLGYISAGELAQFMQPYVVLQNDLNQMVTNNVAGQFKQTYGVNVPQTQLVTPYTPYGAAIANQPPLNVLYAH